MSNLQTYLSWSQPLRVKIVVVAIVTLVYSLVFWLTYTDVGYSIAAVAAVLPAIAGGFLLGRAGGVVYGVLLSLYLFLLGILVGYTFPRIGTMLSGQVILMLAALGAGWIREQLAGREVMRQELVKSEERLLSLITNAPVILFSLDRDGIFTMSEGSALSVLGLRPGEAVGQSVFELFSKADGFLDEVRRALAGEAFTSISRGRGLAFETRYTPIRDADGAVTGTIGVSVDVLSRIRAEEAYQALVETSLQGLVILQGNRMAFANAAQAAITGYSIDELLAMTPQQNIDLAHPDDRAFVIERLQARHEGKPLSTRAEIRLIRKDGEVRWVEMYSSPVEYQGQPATQIVVLDVTERKQMEAALIEAEGLRLALDQERELKELKSRFISMVSHQFRTPMSVISTTSYLLENYHEKLAAEKRADYFGKIRAQIDRLDEMIEKMLTISATEEKAIAFQPRHLNLEQFCRDLVEEMQLTASAQHRLNFSAVGELSAAWIDENLIQHILLNLLSNAIKYSPAGGEIGLRVERQGDEAVFRISDSGIGISPDDQKHLFEPFHRGQNVDGIKGSGLGLKIVKDFVDLHGGTIDCMSEPERGTTFTVRLPVVEVAAPEAQGAGDSNLSSGGA